MKNAKNSFIAVLVMLLLSFVAVLPAFAAQGATILGYTLNADECYVDVRVQVEDAGFYALNVWDDGDFRAGVGAEFPANSTFVVRVGIGGVILQASAGIGFYAEDDIGFAATIEYHSDPNANPWDDTVGAACATGIWTSTILATDCSSPTPANAAIYQVPAGALAFYAADAGAYAGFDLPAGSWYITEFGEEFAKVWIACEAAPIYIPVANVIR